MIHCYSNKEGRMVDLLLIILSLYYYYIDVVRSWVNEAKALRLFLLAKIVTNSASLFTSWVTSLDFGTNTLVQIATNTLILLIVIYSKVNLWLWNVLKIFRTFDIFRHTFMKNIYIYKFHCFRSVHFLQYDNQWITRQLIFILSLLHIKMFTKFYSKIQYTICFYDLR